jgi:tetratricopeptide (TPR) repeat protein
MRLLGRIYLEQHNYNEALKVFIKVLRADPEDLIAHAGRGLAYKEKGDINKAIWHMERAAEIDAYNITVQEELSTLYKFAVGYQPKNKDLTQAAIARLHVIGGFYGQAQSELVEIIKKSPDRYDLKVLLAESLFLDKRKKESAKASSRIIKVLPDCIKPNAILGLVYLQIDKELAAQRIASRLNPILRPERVTLDKNTLHGKFLLTLDTQAVPERVMVKELDRPLDRLTSKKNNKNNKLSQQQAIAKSGVPVWLSSEKSELGYGEGDEKSRKEEIDDIDDVIQWLEAIAAEEGSLFEPAPGPSNEQSNVHDKINELSSRSDYSDLGNLNDGAISSTHLDIRENMISRPSQPADALEGTNDNNISATDDVDALPQWLNEVIGFTDNLNLNDQKSRHDNIATEKPMLETIVTGGVMASFFLENDDTYSMANPEDKIMSESNEHEQEKSSDPTSYSTDDEWLEELSQKTNEELERALSQDDADVDDLGEISPGQEIPEWLAADLKTAESEKPDSSAPETEMIADEQIEPSQDSDSDEEVPDWLEQGAGSNENDEGKQDDLDWLDQLASSDDLPVDDEDSEPQGAGSISPDISTLASEIPDDPDEAVAWLEKLAETEDDDGGVLSKLPADARDQTSVPEVGDEGASAAVERSDLSMPADENQAAKWLEEVVALGFSKAHEKNGEEMPVVEEIVTPQSPMDVAAARAEAERIMLEDTERPSSEELAGSISDDSDQLAEGQDQLLDWLDDLEITSGEGDIEEKSRIEEEQISDSISIEDELEVSSTEEDLEGLETIAVQKEEELAEDYTEIDVGDIEIEETVIGETPEMVKEPSVPAEPDESKPKEKETVVTSLDQNSLFEEAQTALRDGNVDEAVTKYRLILDSKENLPDLIADLESAIDQYESQPSLKRILGEAYTENGQLQKALETYRKALEDI